MDTTFLGEIVMAEVIRYINCSSAGGDGTTNAESGANAAYPSFQSWEAGERTDLVAAADTHRVICSSGTSNNEDLLNLAYTVSLWTTSVAFGITLEAAPGEEAGTEWDDTKYRLVQLAASNSFGLKLQESMTISNIQHKFNRNAAGGGRVIQLNPGNSKRCVVHGGFIWNTSNANAANVWGIDSIGTFNIRDDIYNNVILIDGGGQTNFAFINGIRARDARVYNNTIRIVNSGHNNTADSGRAGLNLDNNRTVAYNNLIDVSGGQLGTQTMISLRNTGGTEDYNAGVDNVLVGVNSRNNQTFSFVSATDSAITPDDTGAKEFGVDLSSDPDIPFSVDTVGTVRPEGDEWDIGAFEAVAVAGLSIYPQIIWW